MNGPEFLALADPLVKMVSTYCAHCEQLFPLDQFVWSDTQETITDYYKRYQQLGTPAQNFLASRAGLYSIAAVPVALGMIACVVLQNLWCIPAGLLGSPILIVLHVLFIGPAILRRVVGTSDPRELN
ncbi:MAG: hypothetical protein ACKO2P_07975 [Planctomycetota bacterium]